MRHTLQRGGERAQAAILSLCTAPVLRDFFNVEPLGIVSFAAPSKGMTIKDDKIRAMLGVAQQGGTAEVEVRRLHTLYELLATLSRATALEDVYEAAITSLLAATSADR